RRSSVVVLTPGWKRAVIQSASYTGVYFHSFIHRHPASWLVLPLVSAVFAVDLGRRAEHHAAATPNSFRRAAILWTLSSFSMIILVFATMLPSIYAQGEAPPDRALCFIT